MYELLSSYYWWYQYQYCSKKRKTAYPKLALSALSVGRRGTKVNPTKSSKFETPRQHALQLSTLHDRRGTIDTRATGEVW